MFARKVLDPKFEAWNEKWAAPFGKVTAGNPIAKSGFFRKTDEFDVRGIFGFQGNNDTRKVEYPWAYHAAEIGVDARALEIGGGMSGFQFTLALAGAKIVNVDPGMDDIGGRVTADFISQANKKFSTDVELVQKNIADTELSECSFDLAYSISVIEHIPPEELDASMVSISRLLKPGGKLVMTIDLFLDLYPFSKKFSNRFGSNASIRRLVETSGLEIEVGDKTELFGFEEFDPQRTMELLPDLFIGSGYPTLVQCLVLRK